MLQARREQPVALVRRGESEVCSSFASAHYPVALRSEPEDGRWLSRLVSSERGRRKGESPDWAERREELVDNETFWAKDMAIEGDEGEGIGVWSWGRSEGIGWTGGAGGGKPGQDVSVRRTNALEARRGEGSRRVVRGGVRGGLINVVCKKD